MLALDVSDAGEPKLAVTVLTDVTHLVSSSSSVEVELDVTVAIGGVGVLAKTPSANRSSRLSPCSRNGLQDTKLEPNKI